jgi:hypothetical protein
MENPHNDSKQAEILLGYFEKGDDMSYCLENSTSAEGALIMHAAMLEDDAATLRKISGLVAGHNVSIEADTHYIAVTGPVAVIDGLLSLGLLDTWRFDVCEEDVDEKADDEGI